MIGHEKTNKFVSEDEIDLLALVKIVWKRRLQIAFIVCSFLIIGLLVALFSPKEFTASSAFIPQTAEPNKGMGSLGGLASIAGINLGGSLGSNEIPPALYPKIVSSVSFRKELLESPINAEGFADPISYREYYEKVHSPSLLDRLKLYTIGLPGLLVKTLRGEPTEVSLAVDGEFITVSPDEFLLFKRLDQQLSVQPNSKEGLVTISFSMPEPLMAAQMANIAQKMLQKELIAYKINSAREQLNFTEQRFIEKKVEFEDIQIRLSNFRDRNQNIVSASAQNQLQYLEAEYNFVFNIYTELAKQLEQAKLQVSKDTPVFSIIQPVTVPIEKSAPNRPLILVIFLVLGCVIGLVYVFISVLLKGVKEKWNQVEI